MIIDWMFSSTKTPTVRMAEDEVGESWEELEDSGELDKRIEQMVPVPSEKNNCGQDGIALLQEDSDRLSYQPQVRILKRQPQTNYSQQQAANRVGPPKPTKTLAEREAAYAEARLRILGSAHQNTEEESNKDGPVRITQQLEGVKVTENVVRQPKGPDDSQGFNNRNKPR